MSADRIQVVAPAVDLSTEYITVAVPTNAFGQIGIEIAPINVVGGLTVIVELSPDGDGWYPESVEDASSSVPVSNDFAIPIYRLIRSWAAANSNISFQIPTAGYQAIRLRVEAGTSGNALIYVNKLRLAAN